MQPVPSPRQEPVYRRNQQESVLQGVEHQAKYEAGGTDSFMSKHQTEKHAGQQADFKGSVTGKFRDCLSRQVSEGVQIRRCAGFTNIMNSKSEWHQPTLWQVRSEIERF